MPPSTIPKANRIIAALIITSLGISVLQVISQCVLSWGHLTELFTGTVNSYGIVAIVYGFLAALNFAGLIVLIRLDRKGKIFEARMLLRVLIVFLLGRLAHERCPQRRCLARNHLLVPVHLRHCLPNLQ